MADWSIEHSPSSLFHPAARYRFSLFLISTSSVPYSSPFPVPPASLAKALIRLRPHSRFPVITISVWIANSIRPAFRSFCLSTGCVVSPFYAHLLQSVSYVRFKSYRKPCTHGIFLALNCRNNEWLEQSKLGLWRRSCTKTFCTVTFFPWTVAKLLRRT